jgi:hypothetical protein
MSHYIQNNEAGISSVARLYCLTNVLPKSSYFKFTKNREFSDLNRELIADHGNFRCKIQITDPSQLTPTALTGTSSYQPHLQNLTALGSAPGQNQ